MLGRRVRPCSPVPLETGSNSEPEYCEPKIVYTGHLLGFFNLASYFPGLKQADVPGKDGWALEKVAGSILRTTVPRAHVIQRIVNFFSAFRIAWYDVAGWHRPALQGGAVHAHRHTRGRTVALQRNHGRRLQAGPHTPAQMISKLKDAAAMRLARRAPVASRV